MHKAVPGTAFFCALFNLKFISMNCQNCNKPLTSSRSDRKYCCHACRQKAYLDRKLYSAITGKISVSDTYGLSVTKEGNSLKTKENILPQRKSISVSDSYLCNPNIRDMLNQLIAILQDLQLSNSKSSVKSLEKIIASELYRKLPNSFPFFTEILKVMTSLRRSENPNHINYLIINIKRFLAGS